MSVTEASHNQIPSQGMRAWKKKTSLWQWQTARCGGRLWIQSRLPGPPDDEMMMIIYMYMCVTIKLVFNYYTSDRSVFTSTVQISLV